VSVASLRGDAVTAGQRLPTFELAVTAKTVVMGASSSRDWQPQHHDHEWAVKRAGTRDIFLNTPNQAGWIERYLTDWTGPHGRLGRLSFRMRTPVCPGDTLVFNGTVRAVDTDDEGSTWVDLDLDLTVNDETVTECTARIALPTDQSDNPWALQSDRWRP
jgi:acyl dehydratase